MRSGREMGRVERTSVAREPWSPAQFVAGVVGLFLTVIGGVGLARLLPTEAFIEETTTVIGMGLNVLMSVITLLLGLMFLAGAGSPGTARSGSISLGVAMLAFGIVIFIEPDALGGAFGVNQTSGLVFSLVGLVAVIAGVASPTMMSRRAVQEQVVEEDDVVHVT